MSTKKEKCQEEGKFPKMLVLEEVDFRNNRAGGYRSFYDRERDIELVIERCKEGFCVHLYNSVKEYPNDNEQAFHRCTRGASQPMNRALKKINAMIKTYDKRYRFPE